MYRSKSSSLLHPLAMISSPNAALIWLTVWYGLTRSVLNPVVWTCIVQSQRNKRDPNFINAGSKGPSIDYNNCTRIEQGLSLVTKRLLNTINKGLKPWQWVL